MGWSCSSRGETESKRKNQLTTETQRAQRKIIELQRIIPLYSLCVLCASVPLWLIGLNVFRIVMASQMPRDGKGDAA